MLTSTAPQSTFFLNRLFTSIPFLWKLCLWNVDACPFAAWCDRSRFSNRATVREGPSWITILIEREGEAAQLFQGFRPQCVSVHLLISSSKKFTTVALRYLLKGIVLWYIHESISSTECSLAILYVCLSTRASYEERPRYRTQWRYWRRWYTVRTEWAMACRWAPARLKYFLLKERPKERRLRPPLVTALQNPSCCPNSTCSSVRPSSALGLSLLGGNDVDLFCNGKELTPVKLA